MPEKVELSVSVKTDKGAKVGWMRIDAKGVTLDGDGEGKAQVGADHPKHSYVIWFAGAPGGTMSFSIKQADQELCKGEATISEGNMFGVAHDQFSLR